MKPIHKPYVTRDHQMVKVYIQGELHLALRLKDLAGVQSWVDHGVCYVEFYVKGTSPIRCEYLDRQLWVDVLRALDAYL